MRIFLTTIFVFVLSGTAFGQSPEALAPGITIERLFSVSNDGIRIAQDPLTGKMYYARQSGGIYEIDLENKTSAIKYTASSHGQNVIQGFTIGPDGTFYVVGNLSSSTQHIGIIRRGTLENDDRAWSTVARSEPYRISGLRDHLFNAIAVTPDENFLIVNSGSRTDHGEIGEDGREFPITSAYFKIPIDADNLTLKNDADSLQPYLFADGLRNSFDMAFSGDGELFSVENCGARDDAEEMNWIREGHHYGFPWRLANEDNPQQFPDFDPPDSDNLIIDGINMERTFYNDPAFPTPPEGIVFTDPIENLGPDADHFRDTTDAAIKDASDIGRSLFTFTPHSSPLAIAFDSDSSLSAPYTGDAFVMSYNDPALRKYAPFNDPGGDILHVKLTKIEAEDRYTAVVTRIVQGFQNPVDNVLVGNKMYVLENGGGASLWEVTLPAKTTGVKVENAPPRSIALHQNYPNPFNPTTQIQFSIAKASHVHISIFNTRGQLVHTLVDEVLPAGNHNAMWDATDHFGNSVSSGVYIYRMRNGKFSIEKKMLLMQ